jgi:hypothetical protein
MNDENFNQEVLQRQQNAIPYFPLISSRQHNLVGIFMQEYAVLPEHLLS